MARRKSELETADSELTFEDALAGLESIVEAMEHEQLPLEKLVAAYEKGSLLLDRCESVLQSARNRIELITLRNQSGPEHESESQTEKFNNQSSDLDDTENDDIRLF